MQSVMQSSARQGTETSYCSPLLDDTLAALAVCPVARLAQSDLQTPDLRDQSGIAAFRPIGAK